MKVVKVTLLDGKSKRVHVELVRKVVKSEKKKNDALYVKWE